MPGGGWDLVALGGGKLDVWWIFVFHCCLDLCVAGCGPNVSFGCLFDVDGFGSQLDLVSPFSP